MTGSNHCPSFRHMTSRDTTHRLLSLIFVLVSHAHFAASQSCVPTNCITTQWTEWSECSQSCGDSGVRARTREILADEKCGGECTGGIFQSEACNQRCCAQNCVFTPWTSWASCRCGEGYCDDPGSWNVCFRWRDKLNDSTCGGYCDSITYEAQCGKPCCYKDCIMGSWGQWETCDARCESTGFRIRNRIVIQEANCGGKRCDYESETTTCKGPCCPQDCVIGQWSDWSECSTDCGQGVMTRSRYIKGAICGGLNCTETDEKQNQTCEKYINVDCKMDAWSEWTACNLKNGRCGEGTKTRLRSVLIDSKCNGEACQPKNESSLCYGPCCLTDCQVGPWSEFGFCSTVCGEGKRNRTRNIIVAPSCGGILCPEVIEFTSCTAQNFTDCKFTEWSQWSACSTDCGNGTNIRTRSLLTPAYCGGQCLDEKREEQRACQSYAARKDCQVGPWSDWGTCVRDCEKGIQKSTRVITVIEACGGLSCTGRYNLTQTKTCHEKCTQLCNQGKCSCNPGYVLQTDGYTCKKKNCSAAVVPIFCAVGTSAPESCQGVHLNCSVISVSII
ncbi:unnamed protein product [Lymnaea stagnalis]|uniref:Spondin-like TSP1 domain-containing protein n=1 Tax=Lymnaea stagnalis TaxID=6523 RepID=A0AAV2HJD9_LYMST